MPTISKMKVQDVIDVLKRQDPESLVGVLSDDGSAIYPVRFVEKRQALVPEDFHKEEVLVFMREGTERI